MTRTGLTSRVGGFTLIELLVVAAIIVVLLGLIGGVGVVVIHNQQSSATQNVLYTLDRALEEYMVASGGNPPPYRRDDYVGVPGPDAMLNSQDYFRAYPVGGNMRHPLRPDAAVFLRQAIGYGQVQGIISGIGDRFLRITTTPAGTTPPPPGSDWDRDLDPTPSVVDVWAEPNWPDGPTAPWCLIGQQVIYYVHPDNLLAQQFYGKCENRRPYFMSAGPDRFYGIHGGSPLGNEFDRIVGHHGLRQEQGEQDPEFRQRVLRKAREDNLYSYPVKKDHRVDPALLTP